MMQSNGVNGVSLKVYSKSNDKNQDERLLEPFHYSTKTPGENIRTKLARAFNYWLNIPDDKLTAICEAADLIYNSSLILNDIEDNSTVRRGLPAAHSVYGIPITLNAANYAVFIALEKLLDLQHPDAIRVYNDHVLEFHRGQGTEIYWRDNFICPTESEYKQMTIRKTSSLIMLPVRLMQLFSDNKADYTKLGEILGLYFQIRDDYLNLYSKDYMVDKSHCEDLTEGKFTFPIVHAIHSRPDENKVFHIVRQRTKDIEVKKYCVSLLGKYGSFDYTKKVLAELKRKAQDEVNKLGGNPYISEVMECISI